MNNQISTKLAALAVALMMNSLIAGGVAYLFDGQLHQSASNTSPSGATHQVAHEVA
jgi:hypothetical protein